MISITFRRKLKALWKSRTHWAGAVLGVGIAIQPGLMQLLDYKLEADDYILAGVIVTGVISLMRWITTQPLDQK